MAGIAEAHDDLFAFLEIAAHDADEQGLVPRADIALAVVLDVQHRAIAGFDGGVVPALRIGELRLAHVAGEAVHDLDRAGVVDAEVAGGVGEGEAGEAARLEGAGGIYGGGAHEVAGVVGVRHGGLGVQEGFLPCYGGHAHIAIVFELFLHDATL
ncbi:hypothetical protein PVZ81_09830 [Bordetella pertussis]|nr:hypothetical protein PVZ81_09830 [Bordetella pertussis]